MIHPLTLQTSNHRAENAYREQTSPFLIYFPSEILEEILHNLDYRSLLRCCLVSGRGSQSESDE